MATKPKIGRLVGGAGAARKQRPSRAGPQAAPAGGARVGNSANGTAVRPVVRFCGGGGDPSDALYGIDTGEPGAIAPQTSERWTPEELMRLGAAIATEADAANRGETLPTAQRWEAQIPRVPAIPEHHSDSK